MTLIFLTFFFFIIGAKLQTHLFLTLLTGQAVIILVLICALVHWVRKRSRQKSDHSSVDKLNSNKSDEEIYHHCKYILSRELVKIIIIFGVRSLKKKIQRIASVKCRCKGKVTIPLIKTDAKKSNELLQNQSNK